MERLTGVGGSSFLLRLNPAKTLRGDAFSFSDIFSGRSIIYLDDIALELVNFISVHTWRTVMKFRHLIALVVSFSFSDIFNGSHIIHLDDIISEDYLDLESGCILILKHFQKEEHHPFGWYYLRRLRKGLHSHSQTFSDTSRWFTYWWCWSPYYLLRGGCQDLRLLKKRDAYSWLDISRGGHHPFGWHCDQIGQGSLLGMINDAWLTKLFSVVS